MSRWFLSFVKLSRWTALTLLATSCLAWSDGAGDGSLRAQAWARWNAVNGDSYALDGVARWMERGQRARCDERSLVTYRGTTVR